MIAEFGAISLAFRHNENLNRLLLEECFNMTPSLTENLRCLLSMNHLESSIVSEYKCQEDEPLDLSEALGRNQSLKELVLGGCVDDRMALSPETLHAIPLLLRTNEGIQQIKLCGLSIYSPIVLSIAQAK